MTAPDTHDPKWRPAADGDAVDPYAVPSDPARPATTYAPPYQRVAPVPDHTAPRYPTAHGAVPPMPVAAVAAYPAGPATGWYPGSVPAWAPPGPYSGRAHPPGTDSLGVVGLIAGCLSLVLLGVVAGVVSAVTAAAGLALSIIALRRLRSAGLGGGAAAVSGIVTSSVAALLAAAVFVGSATPVGEGFRDSFAGLVGGGEYDLPLIALRPGESATVGDYTVTVAEIQMDADAALAADPLNDPPLGRYVQAVVTVGYEGRDVGVVADDLLVSYAGSSDEWTYDEWGCAAVTQRPVYEVGGLLPGEQATFDSCMDVPVEVLRDAAVIVEDLTSPDLTPEMWGTR